MVQGQQRPGDRKGVRMNEHHAHELERRIRRLEAELIATRIRLAGFDYAHETPIPHERAQEPLPS